MSCPDKNSMKDFRRSTFNPFSLKIIYIKPFSSSTNELTTFSFSYRIGRPCSLGLLNLKIKTMTSTTSTVAQPSSSTIRTLTLEYKSLQDEPVEGFRVKLLSESNMFEWEVSIFGPPDTLYQGGYFKATMKFPVDYPYSPPSLGFVSKFWHPNIYENGTICISILHPPVDDPLSGEHPSERWNPTQNVRTVLLSVISLLNEPNTSSPANVDASVQFRRWKDTNGEDKEYENVVKQLVEATKIVAEREGVIVPMTIAEYCCKTPSKKVEDTVDTMDFYDDYDYDDEDDEGDSISEDEC